MNTLGNSISRSGLVGEWLLDGNALDTAGANNGTATNVVYVKTNKGYQSQAGSFNGSSSYVQIPDANSLDLTTQYSIFSFIKLSSLPTSGNLYAICDKVGGGNGWEFEIYNNSGTYQLFVSHYNAGSNTYSINYTPPTNTWILIGVKFSGTTIVFYANGQIIGTVTGVSRTVGASTSALEIGRNPSISSRYFNGQIQSTRIYNRALSEDEIQLLYLEGLRQLGPIGIAKYPALLSGLVGYYDFKGDASNLVDGVTGANTNVTTGTDHLGNSGILNTYNGSNYITTGNISKNANIVSYFFWLKDDNRSQTQENRFVSGANSGRALTIGNNLNQSVGVPTDRKLWVGTLREGVAWDGNFLKSSTNYNDGTWKNWTITKNGTTVKIYCNGVLDATSTTMDNSGLDTTSGLKLGAAFGTGSGLVGQLGCFMCFNKELSADESKLLSLLTSQDYIYPTPSYDIASLRDGLVLDLNEKGLDLSGNGNNGTLVNSPTVVRQGRAKGLSYNGSNQYAIIPDSSSFPSGGNFTINIWVNFSSLPSSGNISSLINKYDGTANQGGYDMSIFNNAGTYRLDFGFNNSAGNGQFNSNNYSVSIGTLYMLTMKLTGTSLSSYVNGVLLSTSTVTGTPADNTKSLNIGRFGAYAPSSTSDFGRYTNGKIFSSRIRNRALSDREIQQLYYSQKGNFIY